MADNTSNQLSKFRTKNWIEINDKSRGVYNTNSKIRFTNTMLKSVFCDYSDAYMLVKGTITITEEGLNWLGSRETLLVILKCFDRNSIKSMLKIFKNKNLCWKIWH